MIRENLREFFITMWLHQEEVISFLLKILGYNMIIAPVMAMGGWLNNQGVQILLGVPAVLFGLTALVYNILEQTKIKKEAEEVQRKTNPKD